MCTQTSSIDIILDNPEVPDSVFHVERAQEPSNAQGCSHSNFDHRSAPTKEPGGSEAKASALPACGAGGDGGTSLGRVFYKSISG